jgi:hypothetical protein
MNAKVGLGLAVREWAKFCDGLAGCLVNLPFLGELDWTVFLGLGMARRDAVHSLMRGRSHCYQWSFSSGPVSGPLNSLTSALLIVSHSDYVDASIDMDVFPV